MPKKRRKKMRKSGTITPRGGAIGIWDARKHGLETEAGRTGDLSRIKLMIRNPNDVPYDIDLTGGFFLPDNSEYQPLLIAGLGEAFESDDPISLPGFTSGRGIITVAPGDEVDIDLATCCMDQKSFSPTKAVRYTLADQPAPLKMVDASRSFLQDQDHVTEEEILNRKSDKSLMETLKEKASNALSKLQSKIWGMKYKHDYSKNPVPKDPKNDPENN